MTITNIGRVFNPLILPTPNGRGAQLVEKGPQVINARLLDTVVTDSKGRPRMGLSRHPADIAYMEFVSAVNQQAHTEPAPSGAGRLFDLLG